ncbi:MAG: phospholipase [Ruminococcus sp.]|nr:phospholipase [Ruminococcus sp.]
MKKIIAACAALAVYKIATAVKAQAWFADTHVDITSKAVALLEKEGKVKQAQFFKPYQEEMTKGCKEPDLDDDIDSGAGRHYYSATNPKGKELPLTGGYYRNRLGKIAKSARTSLEENYTSALCLYKSGKVNEAMHVIARAAHFIEDMCCTVHTTNNEYDEKATNLHFAFEKNINNVFRSYTADRFDKRLLKTYEGDSFENASNKLAKASSKLLGSISSLDPVAFGQNAALMLPAAQQNAAALFLKFYDDCKADRGNYIADGRKYQFKNEASGMILTVRDKLLTLEKPSKDALQKFTAGIMYRGAFCFGTDDGGYINDSFKALDYPGNSALPAQFRLAALGNKRFRIMTLSSEYTKAIGLNRSGAAVAADFDPTDRTQVWVLV